MTKDETLMMALEALEALENVLDDSPKVLYASIAGRLYEVVQCRDAITAIKEVLAQPEQDQFKPDWNTEAVLVEEMQRMAKRIEELEIEREQVQYKYGPMSFQIYLPLYATPVVNNAKLPWVYDQDRSSGNVASMWVTPVARMGANGPRSAT